MLVGTRGCGARLGAFVSSKPASDKARNADQKDDRAKQGGSFDKYRLLIP